MSNLIISLESVFSNLFKDVADSFSGTYRIHNSEVEKIVEDFCNEDIPTTKNDRMNLKNDADNVVNDYRKAFELKKLEF